MIYAKKEIKRKVLGIGIAFLLLSLTIPVLADATSTLTPKRISTTPVLTDTTSALTLKSISTTSESDIDFRNMDRIILRYKNDIKEINAYIEDYIAEQGGIDKNFRLPKDLQEKFDDIASEIGDEIERMSSTSWSGKNNLVIIPYFKLWPLDFGVIYRVWTDHFFTQLIAKYLPLGITIIAIILRWAFDEGYYNELTLIMAAFIENIADFTPEQIRAKDHGRGVRWDLYDSYLYSYPKIIDSIALLSQ